MRPPEQIAADLDHWVDTTSRLLGKNLTPLLREAAEALREVEGANKNYEVERKMAVAERDALIAYLTVWYVAYPEDSLWDALPETLRQRIEQPPTEG